MEAIGVPESTVVRSIDGSPKLAANAVSASKDAQFPGIWSFGVVIDAEQDAAAALEAARDALQTLGCRERPAHATIHRDGNRRWGAFILPDGTNPGALETLIRSACVSSARWKICADAWEVCAVPRPLAAQRDKAWLRVSSASWPKIREGWPQMLGVTDGVDVTAPEFQPLRAFLDDLLR